MGNPQAREPAASDMPNLQIRLLEYAAKGRKGEHAMSKKLLCLFGHDIKVVAFQTDAEEHASWAKEYAAYQSGEGAKPPPPPSPRPINPFGESAEGDEPGIQYRRCSRCDYRDTKRVYARTPLSPREQWERDGNLPSKTQADR